jgi:hypothetical protein
LSACFGQFCYRTGEPEVIGSSIALVLLNALVLTGLATFRVVGYTEAVAKLRSLTSHAAYAANRSEMFENQMNNERETSRISLHDFNELEDHRLSGFLNMQEKKIQLTRKKAK